MIAPVSADQIAAERFEAYRVAAERAQRTLDIQDGIAAGHAWRDFLDAFLSPAASAGVRQAGACA